MNKIFWIVMLTVIALGSANAQSKKERKAMAEYQELVAASTAENGSRFFTSSMEGFRGEIRSWELLADGGAIIYLLFWNDTEKDVKVQFLGDLYAFKKCRAVDSFGDVYDGSKYKYFNYVIGDSEDVYNTTGYNFVPAGGPIRVKLGISHINPKSTELKEVQFIALIDGYMSVMRVGGLKFNNK